MQTLALPLYGLYAERDPVMAAQNRYDVRMRFGEAYALDHVSSYAEARASVEACPPSFVITSYGITGEDGGRGGGIDLAAWLAQAHPLMPVGFLSGRSPQFILQELATARVAVPANRIHDTMHTSLADVVEQMAGLVSGYKPEAPRRLARHAVSLAAARR